MSLEKALNGIASTFEWLVVTSGSLTRRPKKVTLLSPGQDNLAINEQTAREIQHTTR